MTPAYCKALTYRNGWPARCSNKARSNGFCPVHDPEAIAAREAKRQADRERVALAHSVQLDRRQKIVDAEAEVIRAAVDWFNADTRSDDGHRLGEQLKTRIRELVTLRGGQS